MALPAMIQGYAQDQSKRFGVLSQSLAQLGQQVGQQLADREYRKQAEAELPFIREQMSQAIQLAGSGKQSEAYMKAYDLMAQYQTSQNPYVLPAIQNAFPIIQQSATAFEKKAYREAQYGGRGVDVGGVSGADIARGQLGLPVMGGQPMQEQPQEFMVDGEPLPTGATGDEGPTLTEGAADIPPTPEGVGQPMQEPTPLQTEAAMAAAQATDATPARQTKAVNGMIAGEKDKNINWERAKISGLSSFFPNNNISDEIGIAPVGSTTEFSETWSGETGKPNARFSGNKQVKVDDELNKQAKKYAANLQESVSLLSNTGPDGEDKTWLDISNESGGIVNLIPSTSGENVYGVKVKGGESYDIDKDTFDAIGRIKGFSAFASRTGIKAMPREEGEVMAPRSAATQPAQSTQFKEGMRVKQGGKTYRFTKGQWVAID